MGSRTNVIVQMHEQFVTRAKLLGAQDTIVGSHNGMHFGFVVTVLDQTLEFHLTHGALEISFCLQKGTN